MATKETPVTGMIIPLFDGTRLRVEPSTYTTVKASYPKGTQVEIDMTILYLDSDPVKTAIWKNDLWGRVVKIAGVPIAQPAFMAIDYHNEAVCAKQYSGETTPPPPAPVEEFPQSFTLTNDSTGNKAQYVFVKVLE